MRFPLWWTQDDAEIVIQSLAWERKANTFSFADWGRESGDPTKEVSDHFSSRALEKWTCRVCHYWASLNGEKGTCMGTELKCGTTARDSSCEQWTPRTGEKYKQEGLDL